MKVLMINGSPKANACIACLSCRKNGKCVFEDIVNETYPKLDDADGIIVGAR